MTPKITPRIASLIPVIALALMLASPVLAQPTTDDDGIPTVSAQMHLFTTHVVLTRQQRTQVRHILDELHAATVAAVHDAAASPEARFSKIRDARLATDHQLRAVLTANQQKQLDQLEHQPHPELHGKIVNAASLPQ